MANNFLFNSKKSKNNSFKSQRQLKVGEELRHLISNALLRESFYDEHIKNNNVTITEVNVSPDLKNAKVYVMPLGGKNKLIYTAEFATQETTDGANEADYSLIELGYGFDGYSIIAGLETLGSDDGAYGFQTPLATKHAFNGWADKFLKTPNDGLDQIVHH